MRKNVPVIEILFWGWRPTIFKTFEYTNFFFRQWKKAIQFLKQNLFSDVRVVKIQVGKNNWYLKIYRKSQKIHSSSWLVRFDAHWPALGTNVGSLSFFCFCLQKTSFEASWKCHILKISVTCLRVHQIQNLGQSKYKLRIFDREQSCSGSLT